MIGVYLCLVAHESLGHRVHWMEDQEFGHACMGVRRVHDWHEIRLPEAPEPRTRAVPDSFPLPAWGGDMEETCRVM